MATTRASIIVVHGIGQQRVGDTAARWAGAVERHMRRRNQPTDVVETTLTDSPAKATVRVWDRRDDPVAPPAAAAVHSGSNAWWLWLVVAVLAFLKWLVICIARGLNLLLVERPRQTVKATTDPTFEFTFVEAHWADAFPQPTPERLLRWLFIVGPNLAIYQAAAILRSGRNWRALTGLLPIIVSILLVAIAAPLILLVAVVLLLASYIPVGGVRKAVASILGKLSTTLGDAFLFVGDPVSRSAMVTTLGTQLKVLAEEGGADDPIIILAHSQGAAVTHRAIALAAAAGEPTDPVAVTRSAIESEAVSRRLGDRLRGVVTVGSALSRLSDIQALRIPGWAFLASIAMLAGSVTWLSAIWSNLDFPDGTRLASFTIAAVGAFALTQYWWRRAKPGKGVKEPLEHVQWLDIWAPTDLVPNGTPLRLKGSPRYRLLNVPGDVSLIRDHVNYHRDDGETMPAIVSFLEWCASAQRGPLDQLPEPRSIRGPRRNRVGPYALRDLLVAVWRAIPILVAICVLWGAGRQQVSSFGHWLLVAAPDAATGALDSITTPVRDVLTTTQAWWARPPSTDLVVGAAAMLLLGFLTAVVIRGAFAMLLSWDIGQWLFKNKAGGWPDVTWAALVVLLGVGSLAAAMGIAVVDARARWSPEEITDAYVLAVSDDNAVRLCDVLTDAAWRQLQRRGATPETKDAGPVAGPDECTDTAKNYLTNLCAQAKRSMPDVRLTPESVDGKRQIGVGSSWLPEKVPECAAGSSPLLVPGTLTLERDGWAVSGLQ